jgi:hypothetical protein
VAAAAVVVAAADDDDAGVEEITLLYIADVVAVAVGT